MKKQKNRKKWIRIIVSTLLAGFLMYLFIPTYSTLEKYREGKEALNNRIKELKKENENLKMEIRKLRSDHLYIEKIARKELGMTRRGEIIYRIPARPDHNVTSGEAGGEEKENYVPEPNR